MSAPVAVRLADLSKSELAALAECGVYATGEYVWKPKAMQQLAQRGLAAAMGEHRGLPAHALTPAGQALRDEHVASERAARRALSPR